MSLTSYRTAPSRITEFRISKLADARTKRDTRSRNMKSARLIHTARTGRLARPSRADHPARRQDEREGGSSQRKTYEDRFCRPGSDLLSHALRHSTIGARGLNDRVRNGIGWGSPAKTTRSTKSTGNQVSSVNQDSDDMFITAHELARIKPIEQLVPVSFTHRCASTPGLSTS